MFEFPYLKPRALWREVIQYRSNTYLDQQKGIIHSVLLGWRFNYCVEDFIIFEDEDVFVRYFNFILYILLHVLVIHGSIRGPIHGILQLAEI
jgi:hypothetical protein